MRQNAWHRELLDKQKDAGVEGLYLVDLKAIMEEEYFVDVEMKGAKLIACGRHLSADSWYALSHQKCQTIKRR